MQWRGLKARGGFLQRVKGLIPSLWSNHKPHSTAQMVESSLLAAINQNQMLVDAWLTFLPPPSPPPLQQFSGSSQNQDQQRHLGKLRAE